VSGGAEKEKDRALPDTSFCKFKILYFFWAAHRLAVLHAREQLGFITIFSDPDALSLRTCRPEVLFIFQFRGHA